MVGKRISSALKGKPLPPIILPPSVETHLRTTEAWEANDFANTLGTISTTIELKVGSAKANALPAKKVAPNEYLVPLSYLAHCLDQQSSITKLASKATATILGRSVVFTAGKKEVTISGKTIYLSSKTEFRGNQVFVPLSLLKQFPEKNISWAIM